MDIKNRIRYQDGTWGPWIVHREEHVIQSTAGQIFQSNPNITSVTYRLNNDTEIEYAPYKDPVLEAVDVLLYDPEPDGAQEKMEALAMLLGNLVPDWDDPHTPNELDNELYLRICRRYLDPPEARK